MFFALTLLIAGVVLLHDTSSGAESSQSAKILSGAACVSVGLVSGWLALANWLKWRKLLRQDKIE
jgi:hypothetical protein